MATAVAVVLLCLAVIPAVRVLVKRPVSRELLARPLLTIVGVAAVAVSLTLAAAVQPPWRILPPIAAAATTVAAITAVRARPNYGRSRGLPPGSLGLATSLDAIADPRFYQSAAGRWGPIFKMSQFHRPVVCIVDLPLGRALLEQERASLAQPTLPFGRLSPGNYIEFMNDERHTRYRAILKTALSGRVVTECQPGIESVLVHQVGLMAATPRPQGHDPRSYLERISFTSLVRVMFGILPDDPRIDPLARLFAELGSPRIFAERRPEDRKEPYQRLLEIIRSYRTDDEGRRSVLSEILRADPAHLDDDTLIGNLVLIVHVTRSNVEGLLGWILKEHCDHPQWVADIRRIGPGPVAEVLATHIVNETLRMHQSEYFYREVRQPISVGPYRIPAGWLVRVCVRECHDRPDLFPNPTLFNPSRFADRHFDRNEYSPFSDGTHSCFGAGLAVMIGKVLVLTLAHHFDITAVSDGPVARHGNRHWSHWQPSPDFRVAVSRLRLGPDRG